VFIPVMNVTVSSFNSAAWP